MGYNNFCFLIVFWQLWPLLADNFLPFGYGGLFTWKLFGMTRCECDGLSWSQSKASVGQDRPLAMSQNSFCGNILVLLQWGLWLQGNPSRSHLVLVNCDAKAQLFESISLHHSVLVTGNIGVNSLNTKLELNPGVCQFVSSRVWLPKSTE